MPKEGKKDAPKKDTATKPAGDATKPSEKSGPDSNLIWKQKGKDVF